MINKGIPYFPTPANFFDEEVMELLKLSLELASTLSCDCFVKYIKRDIISLRRRNKPDFR